MPTNTCFLITNQLLYQLSYAGEKAGKVTRIYRLKQKVSNAIITPDFCSESSGV